MSLSAEPPSPAASAEAAPNPVSLRDIAAVFNRIGMSSFGGGLVAWVHRETVLRRRWVSDRGFLSSLALSQVMPGANMVNLAICLGSELRGGGGAVAALMGLLALPILTILLIDEAFGRIAGIPAAHTILDGVAAAAVGLNIAAGVRALKRSGKAPAERAEGAAIAAAVFLAVGILHWPMLVVVLCMVPPSLALAWRRHG